ncbi:hypothetical protein SO694_00057051 [Aureococcus anophagefferens]|uniref:Uncharacterized protein n=1 Tax=Aureococcus anophagefferens TaxID=44056 RepID=A0ABR1FWZ7_AURAN
MEALKAQVLGGDLSPATLRKLADLVEKAETMAAESKLLKVDDDEKTVDVMYDDGGEDDDEISRKRILAVVAPKPEGRAIQLTTYLNLARCATRADRAKDAVSCCTLAGGIAAFDELLEHHLVTTKILRARAHLQQKHLKQALRDAKAAADLAPSDKNVVALNRDVEAAKKRALRENKKLAKEVTAWVESAQGKFSENGGNEADCAQQ